MRRYNKLVYCTSYCCKCCVNYNASKSWCSLNEIEIKNPWGNCCFDFEY